MISRRHCSAPELLAWVPTVLMRWILLSGFSIIVFYDVTSFAALSIAALSCFTFFNYCFHMLLVAPGTSVKDSMLRNEELDKEINAHKDKTKLVKLASKWVFLVCPMLCVNEK